MQSFSIRFHDDDDDNLIFCDQQVKIECVKLCSIFLSFNKLTPATKSNFGFWKRTNCFRLNWFSIWNWMLKINLGEAKHQFKTSDIRKTEDKQKREIKREAKSRKTDHKGIWLNIFTDNSPKTNEEQAQCVSIVWIYFHSIVHSMSMK